MSRRTVRRRRALLGAALVAVLVPLVPVAAAAAGRTAPDTAAPTAAGSVAGSVAVGDAWVSPPTVQPGSPLGGLFSARSVWRTPVTGAPLDPASPTVVAALADQVSSRYGGVAAFNVYGYTTAVYTVPRDQPRADVRWDDCQGKGYTPDGLLGPGGQLSAVPIPADAVPSAGSDAELTVYSPSTDQLWEFWEAKHLADGWHACWGGRIDAVSTSPGYFGGGFGASATGLATAAGAITVAEARAGRIDHALSLAIPDPAPWQSFSWPAQRSDGSPSSTSPVREGTRLRLDPRVDVDALHLSPIAVAVARAAQRYGFIVTDRGGAVSVTAERGVPAADGSNPWDGLMGATPSYLVLRGFPWQDLQALPVDYGKP